MFQIVEDIKSDTDGEDDQRLVHLSARRRPAL